MCGVSQLCRRFAVCLLTSTALTCQVHGLVIPRESGSVAASIRRSDVEHRLALTQASQNEGVWVFLTTTQKRAHAIPRVIESLMRQTHKPRAITINIGDADTMRMVKASQEKTTWKNKSLVDLRLQLVKENGPGTKYPTQKQLDLIPQDDFVLILDDDWEYTQVEIERLLHGMSDSQAHSFFVRTKGAAPGYSKHCPTSEIKYPLGYASNGFLFHKSSLDGLESFRNYIVKNEPMCKFVDDMYVSGYLYLRGVNISQAQLVKSDQKSVDIGGGKDGALRVTHERGCENNACRDAVLKISENLRKGSSGVKAALAKLGLKFSLG